MELLTVTEAAYRLGVSVDTIRRWADRGILKVTPSRYGRQFSVEAIEERKREIAREQGVWNDGEVQEG